MLSEHPDIEKRLRQEIYEKIGRTGRPTYDQMRELKYMRAFLNGMYSQFCIDEIILINNLYGRGAKTVSSGVSFSPSLFHKAMLTLNVCTAVRSIAGIYSEDFLLFIPVS